MPFLGINLATLRPLLFTPYHYLLAFLFNLSHRFIQLLHYRSGNADQINFHPVLPLFERLIRPTIDVTSDRLWDAPAREARTRAWAWWWRRQERVRREGSWQRLRAWRRWNEEEEEYESWCTLEGWVEEGWGWEEGELVDWDEEGEGDGGEGFVDSVD